MTFSIESLALSVWDLTPAQREFELSRRFPVATRKLYTKSIMDYMEPKITLSLKSMLTGIECLHVEVLEDRLFLEMSLSNFRAISKKYSSRIPYWNVWNDRISTLRLLQIRREMREEKHVLFRDQRHFEQEMEKINKEISATEYGRNVIQQELKEEINIIVRRVQCVHSLRQNWAALKIQKAYRRQDCMGCGALFHRGIGPFCSFRCLRSEFA